MYTKIHTKIVSQTNTNERAYVPGIQRKKRHPCENSEIQKYSYELYYTQNFHNTIAYLPVFETIYVCLLGTIVRFSPVPRTVHCQFVLTHRATSPQERDTGKHPPILSVCKIDNILYNPIQTRYIKQIRRHNLNIDISAVESEYRH